jgi:glycosyltransferase involved in cell wall biosynthesis
MSLRALHIATSDIGGGAAIAGHRLHQGLLALGVESRMVVARRQSEDPHVIRQVPRMDAAARLRRRLDTRRQEQAMQAYARSRLPTLELFSHASVPGPDPLAELHAAGLQADVVNLHWTAGFLDHRRFFSQLPASMPLVWTLHDMNPFTGGCHYTLGCENFTRACGACPQLGSVRADDVSHQVFSNKRDALAARRPDNTRIVATSAWMAQEARRSALFSRFQVDVVPYGLDLALFSPRPKPLAREALGLPADRRIVLFVADYVGNHRKGLDLLLQALAGLDPQLPVLLLSIGGNAVQTGLPFANVHLGRVTQPQFLALAYSAADVFVMPTRAEAFGQVVFEAMACGTPVAAFDVGGVPDMVRPGLTGLLAPPEDAVALRRAIETLLRDDALRARMGLACRRVVEAEYGLLVQAARYRALYEALAASRG